MRTGYVYGLLCPIKRQIVYVGQTSGRPCRRLMGHKSLALSLKKSKLISWVKEVHAKGLLDKIRIVVLQDGVQIKNLLREEDKWILLLNKEFPLLNVKRCLAFRLNEPANLSKKLLSQIKNLPGWKLTVLRRNLKISREEMAQIMTDKKMSSLSAAFDLTKALRGVQNLKLVKALEQLNTLQNIAPKKQRHKYDGHLKRRPDAETWVHKTIAA